MGEVERLYKLLDSQVSKKSVNKDFDVNIGLSYSNRLLPLNEVVKVVDQSAVFEDERNYSEKYRFLGSIRQNMSNVLINVTGPNSYETVVNLVNNPTLEFNSTKELIDETYGWFFYKSDDCIKNEFIPLKKDLLMVRDGVSDNWKVKLTYPFSGTSNTIFFNSGNNPLRPVYLKDGVAITKVQNGLVGGKGMTIFETPIKHGLKVGDEVFITGNTIYDGTHTVFGLGDANSDNLENKFIVDIFDNVPTILNTFASFKRVVNNVPSKYILRYFKSLTNDNEIDFYPTAFSKTYYDDEVISFNTTIDIDLSNYNDYLDRPITEVYLTLIKNKTGVNYGFWNELKAGLQTSLPKINYDIKQINESGTTVLDLGIVTANDNIFLGDIIDYNDSDITERVLLDINHRFNSINRDQNNNFEGYYYSPHKKIVVRYYSSQVEYSDPNIPTVNIPYYALYSPNLPNQTSSTGGQYRWRDILTKGYFDETGRGVNYPFLNGTTYVYNNHFLPLKRQNPFAEYDHGTTLIYGTTCDSLIQFTTKEIDVC